MFYSTVIGCFAAQFCFPMHHSLFRFCVCCHLIGRRIVVRISNLNSLVRIVYVIYVFLIVIILRCSSPCRISTEIVREFQITSCDMLYCNIELYCCASRSSHRVILALYCLLHRLRFINGANAW